MVNASTCQLGSSASPPDVFFIYFMYFTCNLEIGLKVSDSSNLKRNFPTGTRAWILSNLYEHFLIQLTVLFFFKATGPNIY